MNLSLAKALAFFTTVPQVKSLIADALAGRTITIETSNYATLTATYPAASNNGAFAWVDTAQGTAWLPGTVGGTYYPLGLYHSNGTSWIFTPSPAQATQAEVNGGVNNDKFVTPQTLNNSSQLAALTVTSNRTTTNASFDVVIRQDSLPDGQVSQLQYTPQVKINPSTGTVTVVNGLTASTLDAVNITAAGTVSGDNAYFTTTLYAGTSARSPLGIFNQVNTNVLAMGGTGTITTGSINTSTATISSLTGISGSFSSNLNVTAALTVGTLNYSNIGGMPQLWAYARRTSDINLPSSTDTKFSPDILNDPKGWWNTYTDRCVPARIGWYQITFKANISASSSVSTSQINTQIRLNSVTQSIVVATNSTYNAQTLVNTAWVYLSNTTDFLEFTVYPAVANQALFGGIANTSVLVQWMSN